MTVSSLEAIIVAGPPKTGSSAMALGLSSLQRAGAMPRSILYPLDDLWEPRLHGNTVTKHHLLRAATQNEESTAHRTLIALIEQIHQSVQVDLRGARQVVFVWEGCVSRIVSDPAFLSEFCTWMRLFFNRVQFVASLRDQTRALRSRAQQVVRSPNPFRHMGFVNLRDGAIDTSSPLARDYDYALLWRRFEAAGELSNLQFMLCREEEKNQPFLVHDLLNRLGHNQIDLSQIRWPSVPVNNSLSHWQFLLLGRLVKWSRRWRVSRSFALGARNWLLDFFVKANHVGGRWSAGLRFVNRSTTDYKIRTHFFQSNSFIKSVVNFDHGKNWLINY